MRRDVLDNLAVVRPIPGPHQVAALSPDASGEFVSHRVRCSLFRPPDRLAHIGRPRPDQGVDMGTHHGDDPRWLLERQQLAAQSIGDCLAQVGGNLDLYRAKLACSTIKARMFSRWRGCLVVPSRVDAVVVVSKAAWVARKPSAPGGPDDMHPVGPVASHLRECNGFALTFAEPQVRRHAKSQVRR